MVKWKGKCEKVGHKRQNLSPSRVQRMGDETWGRERIGRTQKGTVTMGVRNSKAIQRVHPEVRVIN